MRKLQVKLVGAFLLASLTSSMVSCSSESDSNETENTDKLFDKNKFKIVVTKKSTNTDTRRLTIDYEVTNTANVAYEYIDDGNYALKFTVLATDGTKFEELRSMPSLSAGASKVEYAVIEFTEGKILDEQSITYEVVLE